MLAPPIQICNPALTSAVWHFDSLRALQVKVHQSNDSQTLNRREPLHKTCKPPAAQDVFGWHAVNFVLSSVIVPLFYGMISYKRN